MKNKVISVLLFIFILALCLVVSSSMSSENIEPENKENVQCCQEEHEVTVKDIKHEGATVKISDVDTCKVLKIISDYWDEASALNIFDCGYDYVIEIDGSSYYFCIGCRSVVYDGNGIVLGKDDCESLKEICSQLDFKGDLGY